jgi:ligand-binding SRPBCC domain-containing protein
VSVSIRPRVGGGFVLQASQGLPHPPADVFPFFADAGNLERITPPWLRFRIRTPLPIDMHVGALIEYSLRVHGLPVRWRTEITAWEPPARFVDEQLRGPYRWWVHEHRFEPAEGGTLATDRVEYGVPGGQLANRVLVGRDLQRIFAYRQGVLREEFGELRPAGS